MAYYYLSSLGTLLCLAFAILIRQHGAIGEITCEHLDRSTCAFAVSLSGTRCVLAKHVRRGGQEAYLCRESAIKAEKLTDWIETDECIEACGLDRNTVGFSFECLLEARFTKKLCSSRCYQGCPNIVDLYFNLAAGEGAFFQKLCEMQATNARRGMTEIRSSGVAAGPGPGSSDKVAHGPTQSELSLAISPAMQPLIDVAKNYLTFAGISTTIRPMVLFFLVIFVIYLKFFLCT